MARTKGSKNHKNELTPKEKLVLSCITDGYSSKETATKLNINDRTVDAHRARIMIKLNIHTLAGLVKYAIRKGLTTI